MDNSCRALHEVLILPSVQATLCALMPSFAIRLLRTAKSFSGIFSDESLAKLLPQAFESLVLNYGNPFTSFHNGDVESAWLMLIHGLDPRIVDHVCNTIQIDHILPRPVNHFYRQPYAAEVFP